MNAEAAIVVAPLPPRAVAMRKFRGGEGLESNPYPKGSANYESFMWEMHKLQSAEFDSEQQRYYRG